MGIVKVVVSTTVLMQEEDVARFNEMDLSEIHLEADQGDFVASSTHSEPEKIAPERVADELKALGNDGTFFDDLDNDADDDYAP